MALKVAIVGLAQASRHLAPWNKEDWELWGLAWDSERYRLHRAFEMHELDDLRIVRKPLKPYLEKIAHCASLYMAEAYPEVPGCKRFPFEEVAADVGDYWNSSMSYALSLAIHEQAEEIGIYGVHMSADDEWGYQKPNMEYLIGLARGRGIKVHVPESSPLCKFVSVPGANYNGRYGRLG